jgi:hypothetical protein
VGHKNSDRARDQGFRGVGFLTPARARHLFSQHCQATPAPMSHLRIAGGIHQQSWERSPCSGPAERSQRETPGQGHDRSNCTLQGDRAPPGTSQQTSGRNSGRIRARPRRIPSPGSRSHPSTRSPTGLTRSDPTRPRYHHREHPSRERVCPPVPHGVVVASGPTRLMAPLVPVAHLETPILHPRLACGDNRGHGLVLRLPAARPVHHPRADALVVVYEGEVVPASTSDRAWQSPASSAKML